MNYFAVFLKKELIESLRTYKFLIILLVFMVFGITNPLVAKLTPDLLAGLVPQGGSITFPPPTSINSWTQFFKNTQQMGMLVLLLVFSGILSSEINRGTLINLLTKGLPRPVVILAKYAAMTLVWSVSFFTSFLLTWIYTHYLFADEKSGSLLSASLLLWLFGSFMLALLLFASTLVKRTYAALLVTAGVTVVLMMAGMIPGFASYSPLFLASGSMGLVAGVLKPMDFLPALGVTLTSLSGLLGAAIAVFQRKQL